MADRITTAIAGEHFVCGELAKRGWIATLTAKNTPRVDILAHRALRSAAGADPGEDAHPSLPACVARGS
jgi:hypothetical protein